MKKFGFVALFVVLAFGVFVSPCFGFDYHDKDLKKRIVNYVLVLAIQEAEDDTDFLAWYEDDRYSIDPTKTIRFIACYEAMFDWAKENGVSTEYLNDLLSDKEWIPSCKKTPLKSVEEARKYIGKLVKHIESDAGYKYYQSDIYNTDIYNRFYMPTIFKMTDMYEKQNEELSKYDKLNEKYKKYKK
jgi:hypothetical protein